MRQSLHKESSFLREFKPGSLPLFNRELSWLEFNRRVLAQAQSTDTPLFERLNFLAIFTSNLDEFYMKRVGGLKRYVRASINTPSYDGLTPLEQIAAIRKETLPLLEAADNLYLGELLPALATEGIHLLHWEQLQAEEKAALHCYFVKEVFPVITPLAVDAGHPFPFISNLSTSLGVMVAHKDIDERLFARLKVSDLLPDWVPVPHSGNGGGHRYIPLHELVREHINEFFPGMDVLATSLFRLTRNAEMETDEEQVEDIRELIEQEVQQRRFSRGVRLEFTSDADPWILEFLSEELHLHEADLYPRKGLLDYMPLRTITALPFPEHKFRSWTPAPPLSLGEEGSVFATLKERDVLVHHPFESFAGSIERFVEEAVYDPKVVCIKMTVYRVGDETPIIPLLLKAASLGKQVVCLVELKAQFDEERNLQWSKTLLNAGVHVAYGIPGLKIHAKTLLIVRKESSGVRCYAHIGTGNYHFRTANLYTDLGLLTANPEFTDELLHFFNFLSGRSLKTDYSSLLVSPINMMKTYMQAIEREIVAAQEGKAAEIVLKMNSLEDPEMIRALYRASEAGVRIDLLIRGLCCLVPGMQGYSENIRVFSTLGRLLEHSRVFYFRNGADRPEDGVFYIGSADWMRRNLRRRVEVAVPIHHDGHRSFLWKLLERYRNDTVQTWELQTDGSYCPRQNGTHKGSEENQRGVQEQMVFEAEELNRLHEDD